MTFWGRRLATRGFSPTRGSGMRPTLERCVGEAIAHHGRMFHAPELSKDELRAHTFAQLSEIAAHARSLKTK